MSSRRSPLIVVMQPTYLWDFPDRAIPWLLNWPRQRTIHVQRPVCAPAMIVLEVLGQEPPEMPLVQNDRSCACNERIIAEPETLVVYPEQSKNSSIFLLGR